MTNIVKGMKFVVNRNGKCESSTYEVVEIREFHDAGNCFTGPINGDFLQLVCNSDDPDYNTGFCFDIEKGTCKNPRGLYEIVPIGYPAYSQLDLFFNSQN